MSKKFKRQDSQKKKSIPDSWRSPEGHHSNVRLEKKGAKPRPKTGYRTDKEVRGLHPSGYEEVMVHRPEDLEEIDNESEAARIASKVGGRKRNAILEKADENDIKVLNRGDEDDE